VSEQILNGTSAQLRHSAIHVGTCWSRQMKNRHTTKTKHNPEKANYAKYSKKHAKALK